MPVVPQGARSGLSGAANAIDGCIVVSTEKMRRVLEVDVPNRLVVTEPGIYNAELSRAVAEHGLFYPPDPSSWEFCSIGGNLATNSGGLCCVKYGVTTDYVLGLEVVLASGEVLRTGRRTVKGVAGYDLTKLFVGSEGTLGVITQATLALRPASARPRTAAALFATARDAGATVAAVVAAGLVPSLLEIMDATILRASSAYLQGRPAAGLRRHARLAVRQPGGRRPRRGRRHRRTGGGVRRDRRARGGRPGRGRAAARGPAQRARWLSRRSARRSSTTSPSRGPGSATSSRRWSGSPSGTGWSSAWSGTPATATCTRPSSSTPRTRRQADRAQLAFGEIMDAGLALGGTITGEHGVGLLKRAWLEREAGPVAMGVHRAVKAALDPLGILNPGKVFDRSAWQGGWSAPSRAAPRFLCSTAPGITL